MKDNNNFNFKFDFKELYFCVCFFGYFKYIVYFVRSRVDNFCVKGRKVEVVKLIIRFFEENLIMQFEIFIVKFLDLFGDDKYDVKYYCYCVYIEERR